MDQFKKLAKRQGWRKNLALKDDEWSKLSAVIEKRKRDGKETQILVNGQVVDSKKVRRSLKRHQKSGDGSDANLGEEKSPRMTCR